MDVFDTLRASQSPEFNKDDFLSTKQHYLDAIRLLHTTNYLSEGNNPLLVAALKKEVETQVTEPLERLAYSLILQKHNLEQATSQENCNATFAIFVPVILGFMNDVAA